MPIIVGIILVAIDQITKLLTLKYLKPIGTYQIIENFFYLDYVENRGIAFGSFSGSGAVLPIVTGIIIIGCIIVYFRLDKKKTVNRPVKWALVVLISGAVGNFIDRAVRGYVVDMLHFIFWGHSFAVFNFADILVVCSAFVIAVIMMLYETRESEEAK